MEEQPKLRRRLRRFTSNIPPFPKTVQRVLDMLRDTRIQLTKVAEVVALDQGFAGRVLKMANSAYFGLPRRVHNVTEALVLLGFANVRNVLISASVGHILYDGLAAYGLETGRLWEHSVGVAYGAQILSRRVSVQIYSMAFSSGLLHDVGKVAIERALDDDDKLRLLRLIRSGTTQEAEIDVVGVAHAEVGVEICKNWNLPSDIVEAVGFHHAPASSDRQLAGVVSAANHCTNLLLSGSTEVTQSDMLGAPRGVYVPDAKCLEELSRDLPLMISSSRQLIEGTSEVVEDKPALQKK
jgi:putative nucleotidyltransferase with HDIG domain